MDHIVVVGAGVGGTSVVEALRANGFRGAVTLVGEESHAAYDRPPLSKEVLLSLVDHPRFPVDWVRLGVDVRLGAPARELSPVDGMWAVLTDGDDELLADRVVVATGARPTQLPGLVEHPNVFSLRTLDDAYALRGTLRRNLDVVVVGAGWIGAEVASAAASIGCVVHVVEQGEAAFPGAFETEVGSQFVPWYQEVGVDLVFGRRAVGAGLCHLELDDGSMLPADIVVVDVGVVPCTNWLVNTPVKVDHRGGVLVDEFMESTSASGIYAIGDCASYPSRRYGTRVRLEHWANARLAGLSVAENLLGKPTVHDPVGYVWSRQFDRLVEYVGHHDREDAVVWRGDPHNAHWTVCWIRNGQPTALLAVNRPADALEARQLLTDRATFDLSLLADESNSMADCVIR
jgi:NADPH-dependent 2,4-dienoyl-CoA reductase/sulfur reductase-like enzyme